MEEPDENIPIQLWSSFTGSPINDLRNHIKLNRSVKVLFEYDDHFVKVIHKKFFLTDWDLFDDFWLLWSPDKTLIYDRGKIHPDWWYYYMNKIPGHTARYCVPSEPALCQMSWKEEANKMMLKIVEIGKIMRPKETRLLRHGDVSKWNVIHNIEENKFYIVDWDQLRYRDRLR